MIIRVAYLRQGDQRTLEQQRLPRWQVLALTFDGELFLG
jgi:hypothetical protein